MVGGMGGGVREVHNWMDRCFFFFLPDGLAVKSVRERRSWRLFM